MITEQVKIDNVASEAEKKVEKWSTWQFKKTVLIGICVNILFCFMGLAIVFKNGLSGLFANVRLIDNIYWDVLTTAIQILVVSKYKGSIRAKIGTLIFILVLSYITAGIFFYILPLILIGGRS